MLMLMFMFNPELQMFTWLVWTLVLSIFLTLRLIRNMYNRSMMLTLDICSFWLSTYQRYFISYNEN